MSEDLLRHPAMLGGPGIIVQIDESLVSRAKPTRNGMARATPQQWVFGMTDSAGNCHIQLVPNWSGDTLLAVIRTYVLPGSEVGLMETEFSLGFSRIVFHPGTAQES